MSIEFFSGDILRLSAEETDAIVIPTNCLGVFGAGMANQFINITSKRNYRDGRKEVGSRYMKIAADYKDKCLAGQVRPGECHPYVAWSSDEEKEFPKNVLLVPTKDHWKDPSQIEWVKSGLERILMYCKESGIVRVAIPLMGAGLGTLSANEVARLTRSIFMDDPDVQAQLFLPMPMMQKLMDREKASGRR